MSHDKDDRYMVTIQVPGRGLGLGGLSTVGADIQVGEAGQNTCHRWLKAQSEVWIISLDSGACME